MTISAMNPNYLCAQSKDQIVDISARDEASVVQHLGV